MGDLLDAPNQQVVRADGSAPWDEGTGGGDGDETVNGGPTKAELLERARELGVSPANAAMSKAELQAGIDAHLAENPPEE
jgi:hypothetical protein